jgi:imidazolonepropionase-like amidohydrolase
VPGSHPSSLTSHEHAPVELIARLTVAAHEVGARIAVHAAMSDVGPLKTPGVHSIEHGTGLDEVAIEEMAQRGVAWTPTLCALFQLSERLSELLPLVIRLGVPVLAGTDVVGSIPREVELLAAMGLEAS